MTDLQHFQQKKPVSCKIGEEGTLRFVVASGAAILDGFDAGQRAQRVLVHAAHQTIHMASSTWET